MKRSVVRLIVLSVVMVILLGIAVAAQGPGYSRARATAINFLGRLGSCMTEAKLVDYVKEPCFPAGCYCMYYMDDPARGPLVTHGFGWYPCKTRCSALYQLVEEPTRDCCFSNVVYHAPNRLLPPSPGIVFQIPSTHAPAGFYLNNPYGRANVQGLYYTQTSRNADGMQHAWIFSATFKKMQCKCLCNQKPTEPVGNTFYVIVWEDWCGGGDSDWDDFTVALIPVKCPCK